MLTEPEAKAVLAACGIPVVATRSASTQPRTVARAAEAIGFPVVLKIRSPDITHKSDVGGVVRNLADAAEVRAAVRAMLARVRQARPDARIDGFTVQPMVQRSHAHELIVGASIDSVFGPVILFGQGGTAVEVVADRAVALPPLNAALARALVQRTRVARLLDGFRDTPAADQDALHAVLVAVSQLLADVPEIAELDINPLILDHEGRHRARRTHPRQRRDARRRAQLRDPALPGAAGRDHRLARAQRDAAADPARGRGAAPARSSSAWTPRTCACACSTAGAASSAANWRG